ncbi:MAG: ABC-2 family transporter protein [Bdellovibrionia bacterium]
MTYRWALHAYSLALRNLISYRVDFWVSFLGTLVVQVMVAYFLWSSIFELRGVSEIGGYTFELLIFYYVLAPLVEKSTMADAWTNISDDIYQGTLTRYIVYPMPVLPHKYLTHLAKTTVGLMQLFLTLGVLALFFDLPPGLNVSPLSALQALVIIFAASYLFFIINLATEMVAFWADNVWSLLVMLKFAVSILGGGYFPLTFFGDRARAILELLPFSFFISFPIRCFRGDVGMAEWIQGLVLIFAWSVAFTIVAQVIWARGSKNYAGVGQ